MASSWSSFTSLYGEEPSPAWVVGLAYVSEEQMLSAYKAALADGLEFPPNLSRFLTYCNPNDWEHKRYKPAAEVLAAKPVDLGEGRLLAPPVDQKSPQEHLAGMRSLFS